MNKLNLILVLLVLLVPAVIHGRVLVMLVNFEDKQTEPYTIAHAQTAMDQVRAYYLEASYGQRTLDADVTGWHTLPITSTVCDTTMIADEAKIAALNAGYNPASYEHFVVMFSTLACGFSGKGLFNGEPRIVWVNSGGGGSFWETIAHELGHNHQLYHSMALECGAVMFCTSGTQLDYGDKFDLMGTGAQYHFNLFQKEKLGWVVVPEITSSGTYYLTPLELSGSGYKIHTASGTFYFEKRSAIGFDSLLSSQFYSQAATGVLVHWGYSDASYLLDGTPETDSWYDPALIAGRTFTVDGVTVMVNSVTDSVAEIQVTIPPPSPVCVKFNRRGKCLQWSN